MMKTAEQIKARIAVLNEMAQNHRASKTAGVIWTAQADALRWVLGEIGPDDIGTMADLDRQ